DWFTNTDASDIDRIAVEPAPDVINRYTANLCLERRTRRGRIVKGNNELGILLTNRECERITETHNGKCRVAGRNRILVNGRNHRPLSCRRCRERIDLHRIRCEVPYPYCVQRCNTATRERTKILSTSGMITAAEQTTAKKVLVATETGMLHQLRHANSKVIFEPVNRAAVCKYMKMITPEKLLRSLIDGNDEISIPRDVADKARHSVEQMIAIGTPSRTKE
ncbi:MAG: hypothetical protein EBY96_05535, partial [Actinobacteria bacterium]|nr:hypothetical protein [Actinomycetota bacterium]